MILAFGRRADRLLHAEARNHFLDCQVTSLSSQLAAIQAIAKRRGYALAEKDAAIVHIRGQRDAVRQEHSQTLRALRDLSSKVCSLLEDNEALDKANVSLANEAVRLSKAGHSLLDNIHSDTGNLAEDINDVGNDLHELYEALEARGKKRPTAKYIREVLEKVFMDLAPAHDQLLAMHKDSAPETEGEKQEADLPVVNAPAEALKLVEEDEGRTYPGDDNYHPGPALNLPHPKDFLSALIAQNSLG
jgi:chromosome segregation ATPase